MLELLKVWRRSNTVLMPERHDMKMCRENGGKEPHILITALVRNEQSPSPFGLFQGKLIPI